MSVKADLKHSVALFSLAIGGVAALFAIVSAVVAIKDGTPGWLGCTAVCGLVGLFQIRRGLRLRNQAVKEGSTAFQEDLFPDGDVHTTKTGVAKPSFLEKKKPKSEDDEK